MRPPPTPPAGSPGPPKKAGRTRGGRERPVIGWREWIALPDLGIESIKAKVDTGARTSSLHAYDIRPFDRDGRAWVRFKVHPVQKDARTLVEAEAPLLERRKVKSSTGTVTLRPVIETPVDLQGERWTIEVTLIRRDVMGFRMLLGRQAVRRRFLVDPGGSFLAEGHTPKKTRARRRASSSHSGDDE